LKSKPVEFSCNSSGAPYREQSLMRRASSPADPRLFWQALAGSSGRLRRNEPQGFDWQCIVILVALSNGACAWVAAEIALRLYLQFFTSMLFSGPVFGFGNGPERSRGGRPALRPVSASAEPRACFVDRPPALNSNAVEESEALASLHSQAWRECAQGRGAETSAYPRRGQ